MQAQRHITSAAWQRQIGIYLLPARQLLKPFLLTAVWGLLLLAVMYLRPLAVVQDIGSGPISVSGLYETERSGALSYAYTKGDATVRFPESGDGRFVVRLRMGGPGAALPARTSLAIDGRPVDLGPVREIRIYQLLAPADARGTVQVRLLSEQARIEGDWRRIGLLLDRVELQSLDLTLPTGRVALSMLVALGLASGAASRLDISHQRKVALLLIVGTALGAGYGLGRGKVPLDMWWGVLGAGLGIAVMLRLSRLDGRSFARPAYAVVLLFVAWRAALWLFATLGIWFSEMFHPLVERFEHDDTVYGRVGVIRNMLVDGWVHWDGRHYIAIASTGYEFDGQRWPNMAFFPLYPILIRVLAPLVGNNFAIAALLVAQLAFFVALLLLYDLVAHDFDHDIAYRSLFLLLVVPTSFFFATPYSESLALALLVAAIWALRRERWWLAGIAGFLLALTRLPGVLIAPILALAYLRQIGWRWRAIRIPALTALLPPVGLGMFMLYQWQRFGTPFAFLIAQRQWKNWLSPPWVIPERLLKALADLPSWPNAAFQAVFWLSFIALAIAALRRLPLLYSITLLLFLLPPYFSNWPWSISRHALLGFPAFVVLALWTDRLWVRRLLAVGMFVLLLLATCLFVNGFLVA
jgi:Mannosyltransferase (PIG-V)